MTMDPNKKILNPTNNSPCPSKSFPGNLHSFNCSTGESAWCLSETEKNLGNGTILRVTDSCHTYPEPVDPPTNCFRPLVNAGNHYAQETRPYSVFNQAVSPHTFAPRFLWTLMSNNFQPQINFTPGSHFQNEQFQYKHRPMLHKTANFNCFKETQPLAKAVVISPIRPPHKVENETDKLKKLASNDLRLKLIAKRRKVECGVREKTVKSADESTSRSIETLMAKTRVPFDIQGTARHFYDGVQETEQVLISHNTNMLDKANSIEDNQTTAEPQNNLKQPKIIEENYKNKSNNLLMQDLSEVSGLCLPRPEGDRVCASRMNIMKTGTDNQFSKRDAYSDKLTDLTRPTVNTEFISGITNVKETKHSIAGNTSINNGGTQIMKNVFRTTVPNKIDQDTTTADIENNNTNQNEPNQNVVKQLNETERDISRLKLTENNKAKSADIIKVTGMTKLNNQFNLDEDLKRFYIKNTVVKKRVKSRFDEWVCRLNQTMEGVLTKILLEKRMKMKGTLPPWNLFEAIQVAGEAFKNQPVLKIIIDRFSVELLDCSTQKAKLSKYMKPNDLMKQIGLSVLVIQHLKEIINSDELSDAEDMLVELIKNIEDPNSDIDLPSEKVNAPIFSTSEISDVGLRKSQKETLEFLKKHFVAWRKFAHDNLKKKKKKSVNQKTIKKEACGNDSNTLKINNNKAIIVENKVADKADVANQKLNDGNDETNNLSRHFLLDDLSVSSSSVSRLHAGEGSLCVNIILWKVKKAIKQIVEFIEITDQEHKKGMSMDKKAEALIKYEHCQRFLKNSTVILKRIIARQLNEGTTLQEILRKAGDDDVEDNPLITHYEQPLVAFFGLTQDLQVVVKDSISQLKAVD